MTQGERIKTARSEKGMTQEELARMVNTTKQTIYKYESDIITNIPVERVSALARVLGISVSYIIFGSDTKEEQEKAKLSIDERAMLFSKLSPENQAKAIDYIRYLAEKEENK